MNFTSTQTGRYAKCIEASKRIRWDIDRDVIRGRKFRFDQAFLPDGLSQVSRIAFLDAPARVLLSQVQGRTYANMFGLVERFIGIKMLQISSAHWWGDQVALEALVRFADEELKHQELFRRIERLASEGMPAGYSFVASPNEVAGRVLQASDWAVLALTCHIEFFTQVHYRHSIEPDAGLSDLYKDVFLFHWKEESQHALIDELEWERENLRISEAGREAAVGDLIGLVGAIDAILQQQSEADCRYFAACCKQQLDASQVACIAQRLLAAYRWQYIVSGAQDPRFRKVLDAMLTSPQIARVQAAIVPLAT